MVFADNFHIELLLQDLLQIRLLVHCSKYTSKYIIYERGETRIFANGPKWSLAGRWWREQYRVRTSARVYSTLPSLPVCQSRPAAASAIRLPFLR